MQGDRESQVTMDATCASALGELARRVRPLEGPNGSPVYRDALSAALDIAGSVFARAEPRPWGEADHCTGVALTSVRRARGEFEAVGDAKGAELAGRAWELLARFEMQLAAAPRFDTE